MAKPPTITEAEWLVMQVLWKSAPLTGSEVAELLAERTGWNPRTVKTLLTRLVRKRALRYTERANRFLYTPMVREEECINVESRSFLERVFGGAASPAVEHIVRHERLSAEERARIRALLDEQEDRS